MKLKIIPIYSILFLLFFAIEAKAQSTEEITNRIEVEIRDTHILLVQLFQSEINGKITRSGSLMRGNVHGQERILAQSVIESEKRLWAIKINVRDALDRLPTDVFKIDQGIPWSDHPINNNEKWSYWVLTDPISQAKIYFEINYKVREREILFTSYPYDF